MATQRNKPAYARSGNKLPTTGQKTTDMDPPEEVEEDLPEEGEEIVVPPRPCFFPDHRGIDPATVYDTTLVEVEFFGGIPQEAPVCKTHLAMMRKKKEEQQQSSGKTPHGSCHVCSLPVGVLREGETVENTPVVSFYVHMNNTDERCHEYCPCNARTDAGPVGRHRRRLLSETLNK